MYNNHLSRICRLTCTVSCCTANSRFFCQASFLEAFAALQPDLAITAAYGNMLPTAFLDIPKHGTLNIHPSLLPKYRGAAPVQRAVQVGQAGLLQDNRQCKQCG